MGRAVLFSNPILLIFLVHTFKIEFAIYDQTTFQSGMNLYIYWSTEGEYSFATIFIGPRYIWVRLGTPVHLGTPRYT